MRNDVDGLGDQVSDIEGKIPGNASTSNQLATKADVTGLESSLAKVAKTGLYSDLNDKPTIGNAVLTITRNNESAGSFTANATENKTINITVPVSAGDVNALPDSTKYGASVSLTMDSTTYKVSASLKDQNGDVLGAVQTIDLPLESVVVSGTYDATTKEVVLTLQDGSEIRFSVADLVDGLQTEITESNKLSADLVDDGATVNKFVTSAEKTTWNGKQDAISDLETIRAGASKGATAVQPSAIADMETKTHAAATYQPKGDYATKTELTTGLATKADTTTTDTLRNDIDGLGDQVQEIEAKIPSDATASNQLATKADLANIDTLPAQTGNAGKFLSTDGTNAFWNTVQDNNGLEGDYCCKYGIVDETASGLPTQGTGNQIIIPAQLVMDVPGSPGLTTNTTAITHDLVSTTNCEIFLAQGTVIEATEVYWQTAEPEDGQAGYLAWWNGTGWKFKSNDTGNVWRPANAVRIAKCVFTDGSLTRLSFTGCRVLNKQLYATKADLENVSVAVDGVTITKKDDGKIQASAVVNQNSGVLKSWTGMLTQYTALETKSDDTQYIITDDDSAGTNVYTKAEVDSLVNSALATADYVIEFQAPTAANGYTWYRKYKSGWVEQGGCYENATNAQDITTRVTLPITMADNLYTAIATAGRNTDNAADRSGYTSIFTQTTTTLGIGWYGVNSTNTMRRISWQVSGMAA